MDQVIAITVFFWLWDAMGTHLTFSTRRTELGWSHGGDLLACTLHMLYQTCIQLENGESGSCFGHVCNWKTWRRGWQKDYSENIHSVDGCTCDVASQCCIHRPVSVPENHSPACIFFILLFGSLTCPLSCFLYYFIAVSESCPLPPPLSLFFSLSSSSIPSSLPLPIFACATFNCSDMPPGKLCLCVLEQALLVMAVVPDVRGGV